ncbi:hypothetical protein N7536_010915 [Penicillium majusculum]|uniref:Rhodopsin domain-containing protein n=1 Tax=Penicillium solitum TaxID=60172 RepID=A0A1V6R4K4_9EURO|nr:uncharacterized protein PENSOL_c016G05232 [Penicillium solitum]KAJ5688296.1 hypothetical protein N7536_010915 [Penicillium majusculum]OQD96271.1 hypothetical protein PENSOL_c016G05232 [Penicillium solitum]
MDIADMNMTYIFGPPPAGMDLTESRTFEDTAVVVTICMLAVCTIIFRLVVRGYIQGARLETDDWLIGASGIPLIALLAASILGGTYGFGLHVWWITVENMVTMKKILFAYLIVYLFELLLIKVSILMLYRRIFGMNWMIWTTLLISYGWCIGSMIAALCACEPISYFWREIIDPTSGSNRYNFYYYYVWNAAANVVTDILILLVPVPIVWSLQMRTTQKIGVCGVLLLGGFVCVASDIRIHYITYLHNNIDITWALGDVAVWSTIEPCIGIICACLPVLQPFVRSLAKKMPSLPTKHIGTSQMPSVIQRISLHKLESSKYDIESRTSPTPFGDSEEDLDPLTSVRTRVEIETDPNDTVSGEQNLDPMAIHVKRVVHWSVD